MLFNSLHFLVFFFVITSLYFAINHPYRWILLLAASCYFYMAFVPLYILILAFTIVIDYFSALLIEKEKGKGKKIFLIFSLTANIGVLAIFKYYDFFLINLKGIFNYFHSNITLPYLQILLPIGLSFHTFQAMSYTIEVYRGNHPAEKHFGIYALYVMFYPQLVAGPIERPQNLLPQFRKEHFFTNENLKVGLMQMAVGLFKKVVIADRLAIAVDYSYKNFSQQSGLSLTLASIFYAFQIYCDFSGYSDMAIGAARIMGFKLMTNFNSPYFSESISEFWKRWHISLSTWFKDYLYIPLGGNRVRKPRIYLNLFIVFLLSGLWHGANWTFIVWGGLHGFFLLIGKIISQLKIRYNLFVFKSNMVKLIQIILTFCLVVLAWVFFRSNNVDQAKSIINKIFHLTLFDKIELKLNNTEIVFCFFLIGLLLLYEKITYKVKIKNKASYILTFLAIIFSCYLFGIFNNKQFIYFQF